MSRITTENERRRIIADGYDVSLPPWPDYLQAWADKRQQEQLEEREKLGVESDDDCPSCRLQTDATATDDKTS